MRNLCTAVRVHTFLAAAWAVLLIPTLLWWKASILWVATMSLYANFASHWSAREGAEAKVAAESSDGGTVPGDTQED